MYISDKCESLLDHALIYFFNSYTRLNAHSRDGGTDKKNSRDTPPKRQENKKGEPQNNGATTGE